MVDQKYLYLIRWKHSWFGNLPRNQRLSNQRFPTLKNVGLYPEIWKIEHRNIRLVSEEQMCRERMSGTYVWRTDIWRTKVIRWPGFGRETNFFLFFTDCEKLYCSFLQIQCFFFSKDLPSLERVQNYCR